MPTSFKLVTLYTYRILFFKLLFCIVLTYDRNSRTGCHRIKTRLVLTIYKYEKRLGVYFLLTLHAKVNQLVIELFLNRWPSLWYKLYHYQLSAPSGWSQMFFFLSASLMWCDENFMRYERRNDQISLWADIRCFNHTNDLSITKETYIRR